MLESMWACFRIGAVWVPTNFRLLPDDVAYLATASGARALLCGGEFPDHAAAVAKAVPDLALVARMGPGPLDAPDLDALMAAHAGVDCPAATVDYDHPCWFISTSGTTGRPKLAVLTHGQMAFIVTNHLADLVPGTTEHDCCLVVAPLSHGAGNHGLTQVARGATTVLLPTERFDPAEVWRLVAEHRITNMFTVPTIIKLLVEHPSVDAHDHSSLRHVVYAGAPMYRADQKRALAKLGPVLVQYFGLSEVTGCITVLPPALHVMDDGAEARVGTCGVARIGVDIQVQDPETGAALLRVRRAKSVSVARRCSLATTTTQRRTPKPFATAGSARATSATWMPRGSCSSRGGPRTCISRADRTSTRVRSRRWFSRIQKSWRWRSSACLMPFGARLASRSRCYDPKEPWTRLVC